MLRVVGRQDERRLRQVELHRQRLHLLVGQPARVGKHRERIAAEAPVGEHIDGDELISRHDGPRCCVHSSSSSTSMRRGSSARQSRSSAPAGLSTKSPSSVALRQPDSPASITSASSPKANHDFQHLLRGRARHATPLHRIAHIAPSEGVGLHQRLETGDLFHDVVLCAARQIENAHAPALIGGEEIAHARKLGTWRGGINLRGTLMAGLGPGHPSSILRPDNEIAGLQGG